MTLLIRLLTAGGLFLPLFVVIYFAICLVGGGIAGGKVGVQHPNDPNASRMAQEAGANFVKTNIGTILVSSFGTASVVALGISFSGILPWCRKRADS